MNREEEFKEIVQKFYQNLSDKELFIYFEDSITLKGMNSLAEDLQNEKIIEEFNKFIDNCGKIISEELK